MPLKISDGDNNSNATTVNKNVEQMQQNSINDELALKSLKSVLEQLLEKKRKTETLATEVTKWKKMASKLNQKYRLQRATTTNETIDIS